MLLKIVSETPKLILANQEIMANSAPSLRDVGEVIVSIVLNLPTSGPVLLNALRSQDMFLAAGFILLLSTLTVVGTFVSDVLLVILDPRIRLEN